MKQTAIAVVAAAFLMAFGGAIGAALANAQSAASQPVTQAQLVKVRAAIVNLNQRLNRLEHQASPNSAPAAQPDTDFVLAL